MNNKYVVRTVLVVVIVVVIAVAVFANPASLTKTPTRFNPTISIGIDTISSINERTINEAISSRIINDISIDDSIEYRTIYRKIIDKGKKIGNDILAINPKTIGR